MVLAEFLLPIKGAMITKVAEIILVLISLAASLRLFSGRGAGNWQELQMQNTLNGY
jgi:hypothetical protein